MELGTVEEEGLTWVEGEPGQRLAGSADAAARAVIEACFSSRADAALLHAENLPAAFFDLSSGEAGTVLQKLRNYRLRLAVVCPPGSVQMSSRFGEMLAEERQGRDFGLFQTRDAAVKWLTASAE